MFKKLKKKIEEGETGTPEKIYSSPYAYQKTPEKKAFPGLPVRLPSTSEIQEDNVSVSEQSYKEGSGASEDTNEILHGLGSDRETTKGSSNDRPTENTASVLPQVDGRRDALHSQQNDTVLKQEDEIQNSSSQSLPPPPLQSLPPPPLQSLPPPPSTTSTSGLSSLGSKALEFTGIIRGSDSALHQQVLELKKQKEKLEVALEKQQDLMVNKLKEQGDLHQKALALAREETKRNTLANNSQELLNAQNIIADLRSEISKLELELTNYHNLQEEMMSLQQQFVAMETAHTRVLETLKERDVECEQLRQLLSKTDSTQPEVEGVNEEEPAVLDVRERSIHWSEELVKDVNNDQSEPSVVDKSLSNLLDKNAQLQADLVEKNQMIKIQQQKMADLKKALARELSQKAPPTGDGRVVPPILPDRSQSIPGLPSLLPLPEEVPNSTVNFQYLKHVIIRYMCSQGEESRYLVKAISTLLKFTAQEERYIKDFCEYKMSWFGARPLPLSTILQDKKNKSITRLPTSGF